MVALGGEAGLCDAREAAVEVRVGVVVEDHLPAQRRGGQLALVGVGGRSAELHLIAVAVLRGRRRCGDRGHGAHSPPAVMEMVFDALPPRLSDTVSLAV